MENDRYKLHWHCEIRTEKIIKPNRPDILLLDTTNKEGLVIDIAIPLYHNLQTTYVTKINKYIGTELRNPTIQLKSVSICPIITSTTEIVPKSTTNP